MAPRTEPQPGLGAAIREIRKRRGLSQEKLGHLSEIHPTWISHIESGRNNPAWGSVKRIAVALEVRLSELARRAEELEDGKRDGKRDGKGVGRRAIKRAVKGS